MLSKLKAFPFNAFLQLWTISKILNSREGTMRHLVVRASAGSKGSSAQDMHAP